MVHNDIKSALTAITELEALIEAIPVTKPESKRRQQHIHIVLIDDIEKNVLLIKELETKV